VYLDGQVLKDFPLRIRFEKLASALVAAPEQGVELEGGRTAITGRLVPILPDPAVELMPGFAPSKDWSVTGNSVADVQVCLSSLRLVLLLRIRSVDTAACSCQHSFVPNRTSRAA
jgi:hypothetical protein